MTRTITQEEWDEALKIREPSLEQLAHLAEMCGYKYDTDYLDQNFVRIEHNGYKAYDPVNNDEQNHKLLEQVIAKADCKLFYDDGVNEYFIYQYTPGREMDPPIAHRMKLNEAVFEAAMNLWFPEEE